MAGHPRELPAGIVTFVFSDIEGSTRLFRRVGDRYPALLDRHQVLLAQAWNEHGGVEVETEGDSVLAAFADAADAIAACAQAQLWIESEPWPSDARIRVRMGVHSGLASPRRGSYVALAVYQAARVTSAAHGGQVLVSADAVARADVVPGLELAPLGRFRLRDFDEPVRLYQPVGRGLPADFPAVRALPAETHNLVRPRTAFLGRDTDIALVAEELTVGRLVTVVGPGGVGKTRLVTEVGLAEARDWPDGVWLVDLAAVERPTLLTTAVADAIGVGAGADLDPWAEALAHLRGRRALLVLDNCEQHVEVVAAMVRTLLARCPGVSVLATSREPLHVPAEIVWRLRPLAVPTGDDPAAVLATPAGTLFVDRAHAARPDFRLNESNAAAVAGICRRLDGLPLAIEVAAARAAELTAEEMFAGLADRFRLLRSRDRELPKRQRTLRALLDWSDRLLGPAERTALRRLSVFGGGFSLDAATAAVAGDPIAADDVPDLVWELVDKSLVVADLTANATRYRLLESVRDYGRRALDDDGGTPTTVGRLTAWYLDRLGPARGTGRAWTGRVAVELENLRALVPLAGAVDQEASQQLAWAVGRYHGTVQAFRTGIEELGRWVEELRAPGPARVALLAALADLHRWRGEIEAAGRLLAEAEELDALVGAPPWDDVCVIKTAGEIAIRTGRPGEAIRIAELALEDPLSPRGRARICNLLAVARVMAGDLPGAEAAAHDELAACQVVGDESLLASAHGNIAEIALRRGEVAEAAGHQLACLDLAVVLGQPAMVAYTLIVAARLAAARQDPAAGVRWHAKAEQVLDDTGLALYDDDRRLSDEMLARARDELGPRPFELEAGAGRALDLPDAIAEARVLLGTVGARVSPAVGHR